MVGERHLQKMNNIDPDLQDHLVRLCGPNTAVSSDKSCVTQKCQTYAITSVRMSSMKRIITRSACLAAIDKWDHWHRTK